MKACRGCGAEKPLDEFYLQNGKPRSRCKVCANGATRQWERDHPSDVRRGQRRRYWQNPKKYAQRVALIQKAQREVARRHPDEYRSIIAELREATS